jgi:hypothetical protein
VLLLLLLPVSRDARGGKGSSSSGGELCFKLYSAPMFICFSQFARFMTRLALLARRGLALATFLAY